MRPIGLVMPRGPRGEKRPADVIGNAVKVMRIATGEETEALTQPPNAKAVSSGRRGGLKGGRLRADKLTTEECVRMLYFSRKISAIWNVISFLAFNPI